jgi:hypothetical protein
MLSRETAPGDGGFFLAGISSSGGDTKIFAAGNDGAKQVRLAAFLRFSNVRIILSGSGGIEASSVGPSIL